jgi:hypothetical protein
MKIILFLLVLFSFTFAQKNNNTDAQMNPDGYLGGLSIHIIPYLDDGEGEYYNYGNKFRDLALPTNFNVDFIVKVPISKSASLGGFFSYSQFDEEYITDVAYQITAKGSKYKVGFIFSLYTGGSNK